MEDTNTGANNAGNWNAGNWNAGDWNTGNGNTGNWNTGNWNTGYLNTTTPITYLLFNKPCSIPRGQLEFPDFFYFDLTEWISESEMTNKEKEDNPSYKTTGRYLREYDYREAWRLSWDKASDEDRRKCFDIPNWDNEVFKEISGIDVEAELNKRGTIEIGGVKYDKNEVEKRLKDIKPIQY